MKNLAVAEIINETTRRIITAVHPLRIILFGSAARDAMKENSDIDFLIVVPQGQHRRKTAHTIYRNLIGVGFAADIIVVTEDDIERFKNDPGMVIHSALEEGTVLYAA